MAIRKHIGAKAQRYLLDAHAYLDPRLRAVYESYPMWKFYVNSKETGGVFPRRVYGAYLLPDGRAMLQTVTAHFDHLDAVPDTVDPRDIKPVDVWDQHSRSLVNLCSRPEIFLDPLGFIVLDVQQN